MQHFSGLFVSEGRKENGEFFSIFLSHAQFFHR